MYINNSLLDKFRKSRKQVQVAREEKVEKSQINKMGSSKYKEFKYKYDKDMFDKFSTIDLVYFFREKSIEAGKKYSISSFTKDMAIMKKLKNDYEVEEICAMCEFLFDEGQDYISSPSINVLASSWVNTIYEDTMNWVDDNYIPHSERSKKSTSKKARMKKREYNENKSVSESKVKIGEW